jgi:polyhydroxybutyrate depolymerase
MMRRRKPLPAAPVSRPATLATALLVAVALLCGSACSNGTKAKPATTSGDTTSTARKAAPVPHASAPAGHRPVPSAGCRRTTRPPTPGRRTFGGRSYLLKRPNNDGRVPAPLILDFHGLRSTPFAQALYGRMADMGAARGFIVVEPASAPRRKGWKLPGMPDGTDDIAYVDSLLDHLEGILCVDTAREYATGMSNGAGLAAALICGLDGRLAGVAPVAGLNLTRPCDGAHPTTIVAFHGTADRIVPYRGGEPFGGNRRQVPTWMRPSNGTFALPAVSDLAADWARTFNCGEPEQNTEASRLTYAGCADEASVNLYTVADGAHAWPGTRIGAGSTTTQIDATRIILDAFTTSSR